MRQMAMYIVSWSNPSARRCTDYCLAKSKAQRRKATKAAKKNAADDPDSLLPKVPFDHQTIDLPSGDGTVQGAIEASKVRENLRDAMRTRRRKEIKTRNYLGTMR